MSESEVTFAELDPDTGERFQRLRRELGVQSFGLNLLTLQPGQRSRVHIHEHQEEVYLVLEGELTLVVEGADHPVGRGLLARVPGPVRRQLVNRGAERVVLIALGGAGEHESRDALAWRSWDEEGPGQSPRTCRCRTIWPEGGSIAARPADQPAPPPSQARPFLKAPSEGGARSARDVRSRSWVGRCALTCISRPTSR